MDKKRIILFVKICFWIGAITDGLAAIIMIFPSLRIYIFGDENFNLTSDLRYGLGLGGSLMLGWTVLLIWGSRKPIERRDLLLMTIFPVIIGIVLFQIYTVTVGYITFVKMLPIWIHLSIIVTLYLVAYIKTKKYE